MTNPSKELLDLVPPSSIEAESGVLGSIILRPEVCDDIALILRPDDFYDDANRKLFGRILSMSDAGQKIDLMLLVEALKTAGELDTVGGVANIGKVAQSVPNAAHAIYYAQIVREKAIRRHLIDAGTDTIREAHIGEDAEAALEKAEQRILSIGERRLADNCTSTASDVMRRTLDCFEAAQEGHSQGISTGYTELDSLTGGLRPGKVWIIAGRTSMGKTALACNIMEYVSINQSIETLFVSLEMNSEEIGSRILASQTRIDLNKITNGGCSSYENSSILQAASRTENTFTIDDRSSQTMSSIAALARRHKRRNGLGLLVIDYLQLIDPERRSDTRQEQVATISRRLKGLARELQVPVICAAQLNRQIESSADNYPRLSHLRESGAIEQDADIVLFVHRPSYYANNRRSTCEADPSKLIVAKQRGGPLGEVDANWFGPFVRFDNPEPCFQ